MTGFFPQFSHVNSIRSTVRVHLHNIIAAMGRTTGRSLPTFKQTGRHWRERQFHDVSCFLVLFLDIPFQMPSSNICCPFPTCYGGTSNDAGVNGESVRAVQTDRQTDRQTERQTDRQTDNKNREGCAPCDKLRLPGDRLSPFWFGRQETKPSHRVMLV